MAFKDSLIAARKACGITQAELAAKVYVTRQAISRWENGETTPGIDMIKLLAVHLGVPTTKLLDLPTSPVCQCCGTPFDVPNMPYGTDADGRENPDYCGWCYQNGQFTSEGLDELIERNVPYLVAGSDMDENEAISFMGAVIPTLKRWNNIKNENLSGKATRSKLYVCPTCGNMAWSMGAANISCCGKALDALTACQPDENHQARIQIIDGCDAISIDHPMTKEHYISFIVSMGDDLVRIKRLYPQQEAYAEFPKQGPCKYFAYCNEHGLFKLS